MTAKNDSARVKLYDEIEQEFIDGFQAAGIRFSPRNADQPTRDQLLKRLRNGGARFRNGSASVSTGQISSACMACTGDLGSKTFLLSVQCHRDCYYCFNTNQGDFEKHRWSVNDWQSELDAFDRSLDAKTPVTHIALTGGEPLIHLDETIRFFQEVRYRYPDIHTRLYTSGDLLDTEILKALEATGLTEIRFSVKLEDPPGLRGKVLDLIRRAKPYIPQVMVEMPVIPGTRPQMEALLKELDDIGIFGINLLEFGFPLHRWDEFSSRGLTVKNPPFEVLYDYGYAGGLPIFGSELLALELLDFALRQNLTLGTHYCSLANKHRDQILTTNRPFANVNPVYCLDDSDYFIKTAVVFGQDRTRLLAALRKRGSIPYYDDPGDGSLQINPRDMPSFSGLDLDFYISFNVVETHEGEPSFRELKLQRV
jgi:pyruvate formate-lyase activating enzyme-like uncharacterized protein